VYASSHTSGHDLEQNVLPLAGLKIRRPTDMARINLLYAEDTPDSSSAQTKCISASPGHDPMEALQGRSNPFCFKGTITRPNSRLQLQQRIILRFRYESHRSQKHIEASCCFPNHVRTRGNTIRCGKIGLPSL
jgi:hypothetical protein